MGCDCAALRVEMLSQRSEICSQKKLMVQWFEMLMTELQEVKKQNSELILKFNAFTIDQHHSPTAQPLSSQPSVSQPFPASLFLQNIQLQGQSSTACEPRSENTSSLGMSVEVTRIPEIEKTVQSSVDVEPNVEAKETLGDYSFPSQPNYSQDTIINEENPTTSGFTVTKTERASESPVVEFSTVPDIAEGLWAISEQKKPRMQSEIFRCSVCLFETSDPSEFKNHLLIHSKEKPLGCNLCDYRCSSVSQLVEHKRRHSEAEGNKRLFSCDHCLFSCNDRSDLLKHIMVHTGDKPFACNLCDYRASQKFMLRLHMRVHTGEKPFQCHLCDYRSAQKSNLVSHRKRHHVGFV